MFKNKIIVLKNYIEEKGANVVVDIVVEIADENIPGILNYSPIFRQKSSLIKRELVAKGKKASKAFFLFCGLPSGCHTVQS